MSSLWSAFSMMHKWSFTSVKVMPHTQFNYLGRQIEPPNQWPTVPYLVTKLTILLNILIYYWNVLKCFVIFFFYWNVFSSFSQIYHKFRELLEKNKFKSLIVTTILNNCRLFLFYYTSGHGGEEMWLENPGFVTATPGDNG